ncbi:MAG: hypothetical protein ABJB86_16880 [Bacteroidota bacterium]
MERNVMSWNIALDKGFEPRLYPYGPVNIPEGYYDARIDFKIWAKKTMAVVCYFSIEAINEKCCLSVFRMQATKAYKIRGCDIDFTTCPTGRIYKIRIGYNGKNKPVLQEAAFTWI